MYWGFLSRGFCLGVSVEGFLSREFVGLRWGSLALYWGCVTEMAGEVRVGGNSGVMLDC